MKRVYNWRICPVLGRVVKEDFLEEASEDWKMNGVFLRSVPQAEGTVHEIGMAGSVQCLERASKQGIEVTRNHTSSIALLKVQRGLVEGLELLSEQFSGIQDVLIVQPSPPSTSRTFSSCKTETVLIK